jgi:hypothetical protein
MEGKTLSPQEKSFAALAFLGRGEIFFVPAGGILFPHMIKR